MARATSDSFRRWLLSPPFQCATQLSIGLIFAGIWVYVRPLSFHLSCLVAVIYGANNLVLAADNHIGTRLNANATGMGGFAWGAVAAGVVLSLALAAGTPGSVPHTAVLCCLGVAALALLCGNRATIGPPHPSYIWVSGLMSMISFGVALVGGQFTHSVLGVWRDVVGCLVAVAALAAATGAGVSVLVLPSLAADEMRADAAAAIRGIGHAAGRFASRALKAQEHRRHLSGPPPRHATSSPPDAHQTLAHGPKEDNRLPLSRESHTRNIKSPEPGAENDGANGNGHSADGGAAAAATAAPGLPHARGKHSVRFAPQQETDADADAVNGHQGSFTRANHTEHGLAHGGSPSPSAAALGSPHRRYQPHLHHLYDGVPGHPLAEQLRSPAPNRPPGLPHSSPLYQHPHVHHEPEATAPPASDYNHPRSPTPLDPNATAHGPHGSYHPRLSPPVHPPHLPRHAHAHHPRLPTSSSHPALSFISEFGDPLTAAAAAAAADMAAAAAAARSRTPEPHGPALGSLARTSFPSPHSRRLVHFMTTDEEQRAAPSSRSATSAGTTLNGDVPVKGSREGVLEGRHSGRGEGASGAARSPDPALDRTDTSVAGAVATAVAAAPTPGSYGGGGRGAGEGGDAGGGGDGGGGVSRLARSMGSGMDLVGLAAEAGEVLRPLQQQLTAAEPEPGPQPGQAVGPGLGVGVHPQAGAQPDGSGAAAGGGGGAGGVMEADAEGQGGSGRQAAGEREGQQAADGQDPGAQPPLSLGAHADPVPAPMHPVNSASLQRHSDGHQGRERVPTPTPSPYGSFTSAQQHHPFAHAHAHAHAPSRSFAPSYSHYNSRSLGHSYTHSSTHEDFELIQEDRDAFLQMLRDATEPEPLPTKGGKPEAPPLTAPAGGILPSASARMDSSRSVLRSLYVIVMNTAASAAMAANNALARVGSGGSVVLPPGGGGDGGGEGRVLGAGPSGTYGGGGLAGGAVAWAPVAALRPLLVRARTCLAAAGVEPGWMISGPKDMGAWGRVLDCSEVLVQHVSALECLLYDRQQSLCDPRLSALLGADVISPYREVYGRVAAACAAMAEAVAGCARDKGRRGGSGRSCPLVGGWEDARVALRDLLSTAMARYWDRVVAARAEPLPGEEEQQLQQELIHTAHTVGAAHSSYNNPHEAHLGQHPARQPPGSFHHTNGNNDSFDHPFQHHSHNQHPRAHPSTSHPDHGISRESSFASQDSNAAYHHHGIHDPRHIASCAFCQAMAAAAGARGPRMGDTPGTPRGTDHVPGSGLGSSSAVGGMAPAHPLSPGWGAAGSVGAAVEVPPVAGNGRAQGWSLAPGGKVPILTLQQSRSLNYLWTVTASVLCAMEELEGAVQGALGCNGGRCSGGGPGAGGEQEGQHPPGGGGAQQATAAAAAAAGRRDGQQLPLSAGDSVVLVVLGADEEKRRGQTRQLAHLGKRGRQQQQERQQGQQPRGVCSGLWRCVGCCFSRHAWAWAQPLWPLCLGLPMLRNTPTAAWGTLRALLLPPEPGARRQLLSRRTFQFGLKYWLACCLVLLLLLGLAARSDWQLLRKNPLMFSFIATCVSMTDRVEATLSRALLRAGGTVVGGSLGLAVLAGEGLRHSPVGLQALVCAAGFLVGTLTSYRLQYGLVLALLTFESMTMCTYGGNCCNTGHDVLVLYGIRVLSVLFGSTLPVLLSQLILPWYTTDWALETMAGTCTATAALVRALYMQFYMEELSAYLDHAGHEATAAVLRAHGLDEGVLVGLAEGEGEGEAQGAEAGPEEQQQQQQGRLRHEEEANEVERASTQGTGQVTPKAKPRGGKRQSGAAVEPVAGPPEQQPQPQQQQQPPLGSAESPTNAELSLQSLVSGPLVSVQASLMKDVAVWTRGLYSVPSLVPLALGQQLQLADRLAALQLVVRDTPPVVHGHLSGWVFATLVAPMHKDVLAIFDALDVAASLTAQLLDPRHRAHGGAEPPERALLSLLNGLSPAASATLGDVATGSTSSPAAAAAGGAGAASAAQTLPAGARRRSSVELRAGRGAARVVEGQAGHVEGDKGSVAVARGGQQGDVGESGPTASDAAVAMGGGGGGGGKPTGGQSAGRAAASPFALHQEGPATAAAAAAAAAPPGVGMPAVGSDRYSTLRALRSALRALDLRRLQLRQHIHSMRHALHAGVRSLPPSAAASVAHPDDTVRVNATLFALVGVLDRATATARAVAGQREGERGRGVRRGGGRRGDGKGKGEGRGEGRSGDGKRVRGRVGE